MYITEALELNQQIQQSQQQGSNSSSSDMFQLPPGIISGVISPAQEPETNAFIPMEESSAVHPGTVPNNASNTSLSQESFPVETADEASRKNSFSLSQNNFGQESLDTVHTPTLDSKTEKMFTDSDKSDSIDLTVEHDFADHTIMETSFNHLKPEGHFESDTFNIPTSLGQSQPNANIVSQFLQNMAMKTSDPMLGGSQSLMSTRGLCQNSTIMTSATNLLMAADTQKTKTSNAGSLLKEVLTCPPASLEGFGSYGLRSASSSSATFTTKAEPNMMDFEENMDSLKSMFPNEAEKQTQNAPTSVALSFSANVKDSMEYSTVQVGSETIDLTHEPSAPLGNQTTTQFSPEQIVPSQSSELQFSPSEVLTTFSLDQVIVLLKKCELCLTQLKHRYFLQDFAD